MWFRRFRSKRSPRKFSYKPTLERLENRIVPTATWNNFGGDAQHTDVAQVAAQPIDQLLWQMPLDMAAWGDVHYGDPIFTPNNVVVVPIKVTWDANNQGETNFIEVGLNDVTGAVLWSTAPMGSITGASNVGNTIVITTNNTNGLANGDYVTIGDMQGDTAANTGSSNKTYQISNVTPTSFTLNGVTGNGTYTGGGIWVLSTASSAATSYIEPAYNWLPPDQAAYDPVTDRVYFPGPGGTIDYISNPDTASGVVTPVQEAFYGISNYTNNPSAYNASIYVNTPLTVDAQGNVYFGYAVTGSNPSNITKGGIGSISSSGTATNVSAFAAADTAGQTPTDDGNWVAALGSAPALSNDGSIVYFAVDDGGYGNGGGESNSYLVGLNSSNLQPTYSVRLYDPTTGNGVPATGVQTTGNGADLIDESTASPMVAPDGTIYMGVFGSNYNGSRGSLLHFVGNLQTEYIPGAFGWDDTASVIPTSMVPSYTGSSPYLILSKYNNYANAETGSSGGNGVNEIAVLDPYASQPDPNNDPTPGGQPMPVMKQILTMASPSPDIDNINGGDPDAVREWCTNGTAVDPAIDSIFVNNEDGYTYEWNLGTNTITHTVEVSKGYGVPYTPTAISPNGEVFSDNGGMLFALGGYSNYSITTVSSANPAVYGTPFTLTTTLASTSGGPTPTGTITYTAYAGANNPLNYNTTPIPLGTATLNASGVATLTLSGTQLLAAHYHITASYSGDSNYSAGQTTIVVPVLETATTTVSASPNPADKGASVTFTATVTPNGTPSTVVQNGTGSSSYWVPIGSVTFMDGNAVLGTVNLNSLNSGGPNGNGTYPSSYLQQVTFTTSSLPPGTNAITAIYSGDQNFAGGTSAAYEEAVGYIVTSTADDGSTGTLRDAINQVNAGKYHYIVFNIPGKGLQTINLTSALPAITVSGVIINGQSENQFQGVTSSAPLIELNGSGAGSSSDGLLLQGSNGMVSGLILEHFNNGIEVAGSNNSIGGTTAGAGNVISGNSSVGVKIDNVSGTQVLGNYIGTDQTGKNALANSVGVQDFGHNNTIGGSVKGAGNVISGNSNDGILLDTSSKGETLQGNYVGLDVTGKTILANARNGVEVRGTNSTIGGNSGSNYFTRNFISGNSIDGVALTSTATGNVVQGNFIGLDISGTKAAGNVVYGIEIGGSSNTIGGTTAGVGNFISGNKHNGMMLNSTDSSNVVQGNYIGTDYTAKLAVANSGSGIELVGNSNTIGGTSAAARNILSGNSSDGVRIDSSASGNQVLGNYIGTDNHGTAALGNKVGIEDAGNSNILGGSVLGAKNVISGNSSDGILLDSSASAETIQSNVIGLTSGGNTALANGGNGIEVRGSNNTIGGNSQSNYFTRNFLSGNSKEGLLIGSGATGNQVQGNFIGLGVSGTIGIANSIGIEIIGTTNNIGSTISGTGNFVSGNKSDGVLLDSAASGNALLGNDVGTDYTGNHALANGGNGVEIKGTANSIGGASSRARNIISANTNDGVLIDSGATGNQVQGDSIGVNYSGAALANSGNGVEIAGAGNTIGGSVAGTGNTIANNNGAGVLVSAASGNTIRENSIFANTGPGISLTSGANNNLAAPSLSSATLSSGTLTVTGRFTAPIANVPYVLEFFANPTGDPEGKIYLGSLTVTPTSTGTQSFSFTKTTTVTGTNPLITATLTDATGDTSSFSNGATTN